MTGFMAAADVEGESDDHRGGSDEQGRAESELNVVLSRLGMSEQVQQVGAEKGGGHRAQHHPANQPQVHRPGAEVDGGTERPHDDRGEVSPAAYQALLVALATGDPDRFEQIPLGGTLRLTSPQSAYAFDLIGPDSHSLFVRPAPRFNSPEAAAEMAEDYWMALCRDVPFSRFDSDPTVAARLERLRVGLRRLVDEAES